MAISQEPLLQGCSFTYTKCGHGAERRSMDCVEQGEAVLRGGRPGKDFVEPT
jgi:hypothetical protein